MAFPRPIILEACNFLGSTIGYHGEFEDLVLRWELDELDARGQSAPTKGGRGAPSTRGRDPPAPRGNEAKTHDLIERPRHTNTDVADSAAGSASVPTRRTDVPRGAAPGRTATA